ncbi:MAG: SufS family cysteine desulfurase [Thermoplasmata archaeon]
MDIGRVRADFPLLELTFHGHPLAYLDSAATSQKPKVVLDALTQYYSRVNANPHRGVYELSVEATDAYEQARARIARFLGAPDPSGVVFLRGTTEALNVLAISLGHARLSAGDHVLATVMEHHSNIVPWHFLREGKGIVVDYVDIDEEGHLRLEDYDRLLTPRTKVVTLTHVSNVLGTLNPVREIVERAHAVGALVILDAAQSVPHLPVDVQQLGVDFLAFSGHKVLAPMGIGVLWGRPELLATLPPALGGGEMITEVHLDRSAYREPPARFEAGTPNVGGAVALSAALDYLERIGWDELRPYERELGDALRTRLVETLGDRIHIVGPHRSEEREAVVSFVLKGVHPHDVASLLDADGIAVRAGHHCAQPLMERLGVPALTRASPYLYNTRAEIDRLVESLDKISHLFHPARA